MIDLGPLKQTLKNKPVAIIGLGKSGLPVFEACKQAGIETVLWDDGAAQRNTAEEKGARIEDLTKADFSAFSLLVLSPGIPLTHPKPHICVEKARAAGIEVIGDIELFHRAKPTAATIGITGTNGKSTTTALIGHILKEAGIPAAVGGNIGEAVLTLPDMPPPAIYVLELSSYQLDLCTTFSPDISLLINLDPDHLDRHGDMAGYIDAKKRIFCGKGTAVIGIDDAWSAKVFEDVAKSKRKAIPVSCVSSPDNGISVTPEGILYARGRKISDLKTCPALQGRHNWQNAAMAYAACIEVGIKADTIVAALQSFPGLAHRQKLAATINGIRYINDSKATNDQAAAMALAAYDPIYWIAGGKSKGSGYKNCEQHLSHIRHAFLIGQAADEMAAWLKEKNIVFTIEGTLDKAVTAAHRAAQKERLAGGVVLLSPACASFDQFTSFEHRGDVFVKLVGALAHEEKRA